MGAARVEVLLRQLALKPKASADGTLLKGDAARSSLCLKDVAISMSQKLVETFST